jgi:anti-sigma-K factor RskA
VTAQRQPAPTTPPPFDPAAREAVAAEYVLGTLDAHRAARVGVALVSEPAWRDAVSAWEARLGPLALLARPESPPPNLWDRISERIAPAEPVRVRQRRRSSGLWMAWALLATLGAAGLAGYILYPRAAPSRLLTTLSNDRNLPGILVEVASGGGLRISTLAAVTGRLLQSPSGRSFHLWAIAPGGTAPVSLAVLPHEPGRQFTLPRPRLAMAQDTVIQISLEAEGGSKTGAPVGPVIYVGRLGFAGADIDATR